MRRLKTWIRAWEATVHCAVWSLIDQDVLDAGLRALGEAPAVVDDDLLEHAEGHVPGQEIEADVEGCKEGRKEPGAGLHRGD